MNKAAAFLPGRSALTRAEPQTRQQPCFPANSNPSALIQSN